MDNHLEKMVIDAKAKLDKMSIKELEEMFNSFGISTKRKKKYKLKVGNKC